MSEFHKKTMSSKPLIPGGSNYAAMHLVFEPQTIRVKPAFLGYLLAGLLILPAILFLALPVMTFKLFDAKDFLLLGITAAALIFSAALIYTAVRMLQTVRKRCRSRFDLSTRIFYPDGYDPHSLVPGAFPAIPFSELHALQIVEEHCSTGKSSFDSYELNVVLQDGRRFNLIDHGNKECFAEEAEKLSGILALPLTDARGKRLSCGSFLALPVNIRENLLYGLYALLIFGILFAFGDGRAWYLTRQSLHWEKIPARVESARICEHHGRRTSYSLDLRFTYRYDGKTYNGSDYNFFSHRDSEYALEEIVRHYPAGKKFYCYVNPRSPGQAVVDRHIPPVWKMLLKSPSSACFLIVGIICMLKAAGQYRLLKKRLRKSLQQYAGPAS